MCEWKDEICDRGGQYGYIDRHMIRVGRGEYGCGAGDRFWIGRQRVDERRER